MIVVRDEDKPVVIRISAPSFTAGVVVGRRAAPIVGYMARWPLSRIVRYCRERGWTWTVV
jgi:hypothetical protein